MFATPSCLAISERFPGLLWYCCVDVREITFRSAILDKRIRISSWIPSAKYALAFSSLRFSNGRTATLFSGIAASALAALVLGVDAMVARVGGRWKKINELISRATADTPTAANNRNFGDRGGPIERSASDACFHLRRLSFSGTCGLPRLSL